MSVLFRAVDVSVRYGAVKALENISLELEPGVVHGVIGPNGAGKSTLIDALSGRRKLSGGKVLLEDEDISRRSPTWRRHHGVARSFQRTSIFPSLRVREQLEMVARRMGEADLESIIDAVELRSVQDQVCGEIAYGTQRSVDLALALVGSPKVVLLDEPCAGLVAGESDRLLAHVVELAQDRKLSVLLVEHDVEGVFRSCARVTVLDLGQRVVTGGPEEVRQDERVVRAYLGSAA